MLAKDLRRFLIAALAGLAVFSALWLVLGSSLVRQPLGSPGAQESLTRRQSTTLAASLAALRQKPWLGPAPAADPTLRLDGVSRNGGAPRALLSINNGSAEWLSKGMTRAGVTLVDVQFGRVVLDSWDGQTILALGQTRGGPETLTPASGSRSLAPGIAGPAEAPAGLRMPPAPASAPGI